MNALKYQHVLAEHLMPSILTTGFGEFIYQQGGTSCHTAKSTIAWLMIPVLSWPSGSPDLSPIKTLKENEEIPA